MQGGAITVLASCFILVLSGFYINITRNSSNESRDQTLLWFRVLSPLAVVMSLIIYFIGIGNFMLSGFLLLCGGVLFVSGLGLRWMAVRSLGDSFTVQISVHSEQQLQTSGVYRLIRHPSYTGLLMYNVGLGLIQHNWICLLVLFILPLIAVLNRIAFEEKVLKNHFNELYVRYSSRTRRLIPWVY